MYESFPLDKNLLRSFFGVISVCHSKYLIYAFDNVRLCSKSRKFYTCRVAMDVVGESVELIIESKSWELDKCSIDPYTNGWKGKIRSYLLQCWDGRCGGGYCEVGSNRRDESGYGEEFDGCYFWVGEVGFVEESK